MNKIVVNGIKENIYYQKLSNGLEIYMLPNNKVKNFYLTLNVKFGSIHTDFKYQKKEYHIPKGTAHFLEHLMFNMPDRNVFDYYSKLGSNINAFTSYDVTCYEVYSNSKFNENLSYLLKYVNTPFFNKEMVNGEKDIIIEEIKMYEDNPATELLYGLYRNIFVNENHKYLISGTIEDIKKIKLEDIEIAYQAFYHPKNMFLILTGNFNPQESLAIINETMNKIEIPKYIKPEQFKIKEPYKVAAEYTEKDMNVDKPKISLGLKIPKSNFKNLKYPNLELKLYLNIIMRINFGATSLFSEELISNNIITDTINMSLIETNDYFIQAILVSTDYPDYFIKKIKEKFTKLEISEAEISRKVKGSISNLIMLFDDIEAVNGEIQNDILNYGYYISDIYNQYQSLNKEKAMKVINKLHEFKVSISILKSKENQ